MLSFYHPLTPDPLSTNAYPCFPPIPLTRPSLLTDVHLEANHEVGEQRIGGGLDDEVGQLHNALQRREHHQQQQRSASGAVEESVELMGLNS